MDIRRHLNGLDAENPIFPLANCGPSVKYCCKLDPQWTMLKISRHCQTLTGYSREEIINNRSISYSELIVEEDRATVWNSVQKAASTQRPFQMTYRITARDGSPRTIWEQGEVLDIGNGNKIVEGILVDVSDPSSNELWNENAGQRFNTLIQMAPTGIVILRRGIISYANPSALAMFKYENAEDIIGRRADTFIAQEQQTAFTAERSIREQSEQILPPVNFQLLRNDGKRIDVEIQTSTLDTEQKIIVAFLSDVTEKKREHNQLVDNEEKFHRIFQHSPQGVFLERTADRTILDVNPAYESIVGKPKSEIVGKTLEEAGIITLPEYQTRIIEEFTDTGMLREREIPLKRPDGTTVWVAISAEFLNLSGEPSFLCFVSDRTHIKQFEQRIKKGLEDSICAISTAIEKRDAYIAGHQKRVELLAELIARQLGLDEERIHPLKLAASIHDIGKINIPAEILSKPGRLNPIEFELIKTHSSSGYDILKNIDFPWPIADMVLQHHERMDGSGYPNGLHGEEILLEARIIGVADVIEAMSSHRPYRPALGLNIAIQELEKNRGALYDTAVVDAALAVIGNQQLNSVWQSGL